MASWSLSLVGSFRLLDPHGTEVRLATWKTEALLVMLVRGGPQGVSREHIFAKLWPGQDATQASANLRQTVRRLRQSVGPDSVITNRWGCQLSSGFGVDIHEAGDDPHFADRSGNDVSLVRTPTSALLQVLTWAIERDPARAIDLMRSNHDIMLEFSPIELKPLSDRLMRAFRPSDPLYGWAVYFRGNAEFQTAGFQTVWRTFGIAFEMGRQFGDEQLMSLAGVFLAAVALSHGRIGAAKKILDKLEGLVGHLKSSHVPGLLLYGRATISLHSGNMPEAIQIAERAIELIAKSAHDQAHAEALWAQYLAASGRTDAARMALASPTAYARSNDFHRLDLMVQLAEQMILSRENEFDGLQRLSAPLIRRAVSTGSSQLEVQAREVLAAGAWEAGDKELAFREWEMAHRLRSQLGIHMTPWDTARLKNLPFTETSESPP